MCRELDGQKNREWREHSHSLAVALAFVLSTQQPRIWSIRPFGRGGFSFFLSSLLLLLQSTLLVTSHSSLPFFKMILSLLFKCSRVFTTIHSFLFRISYLSIFLLLLFSCFNSSSSSSSNCSSNRSKSRSSNSIFFFSPFPFSLSYPIFLLQPCPFFFIRLVVFTFLPYLAVLLGSAFFLIAFTFTFTFILTFTLS